MTRRVAVIGGGLAGLSAAVRLADAGADVTVLEARPRLGGATYSFTRDGLRLDNGQHVFLRCCTAYRAFLDRLGVAGLTTLQPRLDVTVLRAGRRPARLCRAALPAPLHLGPALLGYAALPAADRARAARAALAMRRLDPRDPAVDGRSFGSWLAEQGQSPAAVAALWELVTVATLNLPADQASLGLAAKVVQTGLLEHADAADLGYSAVPLGRLHGLAAENVLDRAGAQVRTRAKVTGLARDAAGGWLVGLGDRVLAADAVVLAVPHPAAARLCPPGALDRLDAVRGLGESPIVNCHVVYDRPVLDRPFAAALDSPVQWIFDRTGAAGLDGGQYLALSLSAADAWIDASVATLRATMTPALAALIPRARRARVTAFHVTRERAATFRQSPGTLVARPPQATRLPGLALAGAWTNTGWPATMESAVRSGNAAADVVLAASPTREAISR
jgi:squalene-associated FAD-dependent desaturase